MLKMSLSFCTIWEATWILISITCMGITLQAIRIQACSKLNHKYFRGPGPNVAKGHMLLLLIALSLAQASGLFKNSSILTFFRIIIHLQIC